MLATMIVWASVNASPTGLSDPTGANTTEIAHYRLVPRQLLSKLFVDKLPFTIANYASKEVMPWEIPVDSRCTVWKEYYNMCRAEFWMSEEKCEPWLDVFRNCRVKVGYSKEKQRWMACYSAGPLEQTVKDTAAMRCIIDLHYRQRHLCISIKGTPCEAGYDGMLRRGQFTHRKKQISAQCSRTMQAAADSVLGAKTDGGEIRLWALNHRWRKSEDMVFDGDSGKSC